MAKYKGSRRSGGGSDGSGGGGYRGGHSGKGGSHTGSSGGGSTAAVIVGSVLFLALPLLLAGFVGLVIVRG